MLKINYIVVKGSKGIHILGTSTFYEKRPDSQVKVSARSEQFFALCEAIQALIILQ